MIETSSPDISNNAGTTGETKMSKLLSIALAFNLAAIVAPTVAQAAKAKAAPADRCAARPGDFRRQCFIELGATCEPATGQLWLRGPSGGSILGEARLEACLAQKRSQARR
jgi:hypothetical protein